MTGVTVILTCDFIVGQCKSCQMTQLNCKMKNNISLTESKFNLQFLTLVLLNKLRCHATSNFQPIRLLDPNCCYKFIFLMADSADPDLLASSEAN